MKIGLVSDIHAEQDRDWGELFLKETLIPLAEASDVLVIAGDIAPVICPAYQKVVWGVARVGKPVVVTHGNHEFYGSDRLSVRKQMEHLPPNVVWLDHSAVHIGGVEFLGGTGWFDQRAVDPALCANFSDFHWIRDLHSWVWTEHVAFRQFLRTRAGAPATGKRVLVMHHAPSRKAVLPRWQRSDINDFFFVDVEKEIVELAPAMVLHGHMHSGLFYAIGDIPVYANPRGYPREFQEQPFNPNFVIEVTP